MIMMHMHEFLFLWHDIPLLLRVQHVLRDTPHLRNYCSGPGASYSVHTSCISSLDLVSCPIEVSPPLFSVHLLSTKVGSRFCCAILKPFLTTHHGPTKNETAIIPILLLIVKQQYY